MRPNSYFFLCLLLMLQTLWAQTSPLILKRADSLAVSRKSGHYLLKGNVQFEHDSIFFKTEQAIWNKSADRVNCSGGFYFQHPGGTLKAKEGAYHRKTEFATATGAIEARDSTGELAFFGEHLRYDRIKHYLELPAQPLIHRYYTKEDSLIDTLQIKAGIITYNDSTGLADAKKDVVFTRGDLKVTCGHGQFFRHENRMILKEKPVCQLKDNVLSGDYMEIELEGEKLKSVLVVKSAFGSQKSLDKNTERMSYTEVEGDTIFVQFIADKISEIFVSTQAKGRFFEETREDFINNMDGNRLNLKFIDGKVSLATVSGKARSSYYYFSEEELEGKNEASGDTIKIRFLDDQIQSLQVLGEIATGTYYEAEKSKLKKSDQSLNEDSESATAPKKKFVAKDSTKANKTRKQLRSAE